MTRERALAISDLLVEKGFSHTIQVGVTESYNPREHYRVELTPLRYGTTHLADVLKIAESVFCGLSYSNGSFYLVENES